MSESQPRPPMELEQWLSIVIALPSHRSLNEGHREFGTRLVKLVYDELPAQYAEDTIARAYLNHMLAEVAWAVRGFSNVRDDFQRHVLAAAAQTEYDKGRARGWGELSPLKPATIGGKVLSLAVGAGGATALNRALPALPVGWNVAAVLVIAYAVHLFLDWLQAQAVKRALAREPKDTLDSWRSDTRPQYVAIARAFLEKAQVIEQRFYPEGSGVPPSGEANEAQAPNFEQLINRALSFGAPQTK